MTFRARDKGREPPNKKTKRVKSKYLPSNGIRNNNAKIPSGLHGVLLTCPADREFAAAQECIAILDQTWDEIIEILEKSNHRLSNEEWMQQYLREYAHPVQGERKNTTNSKQEEEEEEERIDSELKLKESKKDGHVLDESQVKTTSALENENRKPCPLIPPRMQDDGARLAYKKRDDHDARPAIAFEQRNSNVDIAAALEEELQGIRSMEKVKFRFVDTGCKGLSFIRFLSNRVKKKQAQGRKEGKGEGKEEEEGEGEEGEEEENADEENIAEEKEEHQNELNPSFLVEAIVRHAIITRRSRSRHTMKLLPAEATCYVSIPEIEKVVKPIIQHHFPSSPSIKFSVLLESRAHGNLDKMQIIQAIAALIPEPHAVDLTKPEKCIVVQILKTSCVIGVVRNFKELSKYNLRQITSPPEEEEKEKEKEKENEEWKETRQFNGDSKASAQKLVWNEAKSKNHIIFEPQSQDSSESEKDTDA